MCRVSSEPDCDFKCIVIGVLSVGVQARPNEPALYDMQGDSGGLSLRSTGVMRVE